jgi:hypothetical protein
MTHIPHLHIGFADFVVFMLYLLVAGGVLRLLEFVWHGNVVGQALNVIY